jgi:hypothetical protein
MHRPTITASGAMIAALLYLSCGSPTPPPPRAPASGPARGASAADAQPGADRAAALTAVEELESAIAAAHAAVASASQKAGAATGDEQLRISDTRRGIVAANVALQKAREAVGREDYAAAQQATLGVAEHLKGVSEKIRH